MTSDKDPAEPGQKTKQKPNVHNDIDGRKRAAALSGGRVYTLIILAGLAMLVTACFLPLLDYFFSQDDFGLMYNSTYKPERLLEAAFGSAATYFRPLTRYAYFAVTYRLFGMHPLPYHVLSLVLHLCTSLLLYVLLRRFRLSEAPAILATGSFALNVAFFHVVAWVSCIQQVAAAFFFLSTIILTLDAIRDKSNKKLVLSVAAYLLALLSLEQTLSAPALIFVIATLGLTGPRVSLRETIKTLWPHFLILGIYLAVRFFWKGVPQGGTLRFVFDTNVLHNLVIYLGAMYDFWPNISNVIPNFPVKLVPSHVILGLLVFYHLSRRRFRQVLFGLVFVLSTLLPLLFLHGHFFYYHTYLPAFGTIYLLGLALEDAFTQLGRLRFRARSGQLLVAAMAILVIATFSYHKVRENERRAVDRNTWQEASFVLRHAQMAETAYYDLTAKAGDMTGVDEVHMVYLPPGQRTIVRQNRDLYWALGAGAAVNVFFAGCDFNVTVERSTLGLRGWESERSRVFFYDDNGHCYTYDEVMGGGVN